MTRDINLIVNLVCMPCGHRSSKQRGRVIGRRRYYTSMFIKLDAPGV